MAETPLKRDRSEIQSDDGEEAKRHKSYSDILSILDDEEEDSTQDLSSLLSILQQELSSVPENESANLPASFATANGCSSSSSPSSFGEQLKDDEDDKDSVIRHLLKASDDELGIPNSDHIYSEEDEHVNSSDLGFALCDGLWELEDEAANYYTLLQSELFM